MIIDVHHHFLPKEYFVNLDILLPSEIGVTRQGEDLLFKNQNDGYLYLRTNPTVWCDSETRLRSMDAAGIHHAVLSAACYQDWMTISAARIINDGTAQVVARHPDRFSGMISVPPDGGQEMVQEIKRAKNELGLCAINITTTHKGRYPDHKDFHLLLATAERLALPVYVHPSWRGPQLHMDQWNLERSIGKATDLNLGIARLIFSGAFNEFPELRMLFAHLGGALPMTLRRLFYGQPGWLSTPNFDYPSLLKRVFIDTAPGMWQSPIEIAFAAKNIGADQMLLGSDYPLSNDPAQLLRAATEHVRLADITDREKAKIFYANAIGLFGLRGVRQEALMSGCTHAGS
jgi:aminocarboxymuconate-semialdehyde decarboxylase